MSWQADDSKLLAYTDEFLRDLAGNAFHSGCCAAVMLSTMATFGIAIKRASGCKVHAVRHIKLFQGAALIEDTDAAGADDLHNVWG